MKNLNSNTILTVAVIVMFVYLVGDNQGWWNNKSPNNVPIVPDGPASVEQTAVRPLVGVLQSKKTKESISGLFLAMADVVERDTKTLETAAQLQIFLKKSLTFHGQNTGLLTAEEAAGMAVSDKILMNAVGNSPGILTPDRRAKAVTRLRSMSWAVEQ